jgi:tetraprenyl-beta-curcumene synthase
MGRANARFWPTVLPRVQRGLRHWEKEAGRIPNDRLREIALAKIAEERFNTEVAATLATLAPRRHRAQAIDAIVPLQVMYDYLDGLGEEPADDPLANGQQLFSAFTVSLTPEEGEPMDYYAFAADRDDGGYLTGLVTSCRQAFAGLPAAAAVAPVACEAAQRCGASQTRTHAVASLGVEQLSEWASEQAQTTGLTWWEYTAGATASVLCVHALIAAAADPLATAVQAEDLDFTYLYISTISTLLDSVIDYQSDRREGGHSFIDHYPDEAAMGMGIERVIARATSEARRMRHGAHHQMTAVGVAAYYLSAPSAAVPPGPAIRRRALEELGSPLVAALAIFRLWRLGKTFADRRPHRA